MALFIAGTMPQIQVFRVTKALYNVSMAVYLLILFVHFSYAAWVLKRNLFSLEVGPIKSPAAILIGLVILNGFSVSVWFWPSGNWILFNWVFHVVLAIDEVIRCRKVSARWPFLVNHILWALWIWNFSITIVAAS